MHQTGFAILECFGARVPKFSDHSQSIYAQFLVEAEVERKKLDPTEAEIAAFENRWIGISGLLSRHTTTLETLADFQGEHVICERNAIEYVMSMLEMPIFDELRSMRSVFEMARNIRARFEAQVPLELLSTPDRQ